MKSVTVQDLLREVENEYQYLKGSTPYRKDTAKLALRVLQQAYDVTPFINRSTSLRYVKRVLRHADADRCRDVAKMLNVVLGNLNLEENLSDETKERLNVRRLNRPIVKLVSTKFVKHS